MHLNFLYIMVKFEKALEKRGKLMYNDIKNKMYMPYDTAEWRKNERV